MSSNSPELLNDSELGTQEYWENVYKEEVKNLKEIGDEGEVWFGEDAMYRMIKKLDRMVDSDEIQYSSPIIDLGTGNGVMLRELDDFGFSNLTGIDYSTSSVQLSKEVCKDIDCKIQQQDILEENQDFVGKFLVALDKGTFDAISLSPHNKQESMDCYIRNVANMLQTDGYLLITSCNWTSDELKFHFQKFDTFNIKEILNTPSFKFRGKTGNSVAAVLFKKI